MKLKRLGVLLRILLLLFESLIKRWICCAVVLLVSETVANWCSVKDVFFKTLKNSRVNTCAGVSFLIKLQASNLHFYQKRYSGPRVSSESFKLFKNSDFCGTWSDDYFHIMWWTIMTEYQVENRETSLPKLSGHSGSRDSRKTWGA